MSDYTEVAAVSAGKRLGIQWCPWMGDWFTSWSPRNDNSNAEGPWEQWVDLALRVLADPMTAIVRPDVHKPELAELIRDGYDGAERYLTDDELTARLREATS